MSYNKLTLDSFKKALAEGKYETATGARRAVGKATTLSKEELEKARKAIDAHFGEAGGKPATKAAPKKTATKKAAAAKPAKKAASTAPKKASAVKATPKKTTSASSTAAPHVAAVKEQIPQLDREIAADLHLGERTLTSLSTAMSSLSEAKKQYPGVDLNNVVRDIGERMSEAVGIFKRVVAKVTPRDVQAAVGNSAEPESQNGVAGRQTFEEALPPVAVADH